MIQWPARIELAQLPTPVTKLEKFSQRFADTTIWVKHDELTGTEVSGNKIRKLEFCIAEAKAQGCDTLITCGGIQSNHCRATAVLGARLGMKVHLILRGEEPAVPEGNLLMDYLSGAEISYLPQSKWRGHEELAQELQASYEEEGRKAFFIPVGASDEVGIWGYIKASEELNQDFVNLGIVPEYIVTATGSGGTQAGLIVGTALLGMKSQVLAFNVSDDAAYFEKKIQEDVTLWKQRYNQKFDQASMKISTVEGYLGPGYGVAGPEIFDTIAELARTEGVFLDPVYTGKAFHGMVAELEKGDAGALAGAKNVVFIHTGGLFGVFPQQQNFHFT
ncbi:MAG: putative 1-aminocyclopropane-1-carboxylate deaminase [Pseudohongiella sp.]|nr:MAG: putative 1-aminocyclopropane-1-carboxylate deaminase [Pseudohongiella sp.]